MDLFDAIRDIKKQYSDISEDEIRSAMDNEVAAEESRITGRNKYARAVESAHYRILEWLKNGDEYIINLNDLDDLARFVASHRTACVWAVIKCKAAKQARLRKVVSNAFAEKEI